MKKLAIALALTVLSSAAYADSCKVTSAEKKLAGAAHEQLHEEMRDRREEVVRRGGGGKEAARRGQDELHQEMRDRRGRRLNI